MSNRPVIRLRPKTDPRPLKRGFPWVYDNQLVTDRRTRALPPGSIATLEDTERQPLATVTINPNSKIIARVLDTDPSAEIDRDWLRRRIERALALREALYDAPFYRLIHAEADGFPGTVVDRFGDALVIQPNAAWIDAMLPDFADILSEITGATTIIKNAQGRARGLEGLDDASSVLMGSLDGPVPVPMNCATYMADLDGGQKTGLFYDQRPNHAFVARVSRGRNVLDVFSHVGGFALAALANGATAALSIDGSEAALHLAERGADATGVADHFTTRKGDAFDTLAALGEEGRQFGSVICDPPAFAPSKSSRDAGLRAYEKIARLAAPLVEPDGFLTLCSCSGAADLAAFQSASLRGIGRAGRFAQLLRVGQAGPDHPRLPALDESGYLKTLIFRLA
ncbi:MAG: class I SAM-dependent rRNA methyltransferase [Silicimonas sp.]|nr:class I SAM-dependent rRNA methyltransferase [Silicimonas sp.]